MFIAWPDGKSYFEQDNILFSMFSIIRGAYIDHVNREAKKAARKLKGSN